MLHLKLKIEKRLEHFKYENFLISVVSLIISLVIMGIFIWINTGNFADVVETYKELFTWPFFPELGLVDTILKMIPLALIALGLLVVFKMKVWNIGAEGQLYLGAMATTWGALFLFKNMSNSISMITLLLIFGAIAGALWALIPAILKAFLKLDEIVTTLMLNYIAVYWLNYLIYGPWKDPKGFNFPLTAVFPKNSWLPELGDTGIHIGIIITFILVFVTYFIMYKTHLGFELKIIGDNPKAARYSGISIEKNLIIAMIFSGALAGLAGSIQVLGVQHRLQHGFSTGYGYTAIIVAWLARLNPFSAVIVAFLFGGLLVGGEQLQIVMRFPISMISALQGLILFSLLASEAIFKYRIKITKNDPIKIGGEFNGNT